MSEKIANMFRLAKNISLFSDFRKPSKRMGAVLARGGKVLSVACNISKTHPLSKTGSIHCEHRTIIIAQNIYSNLEKTDIYIYRQGHAEGYNSTIALLAKPCENCMSLLKQVGVQRIYYTINNGMEMIYL